MVYRCIGNPEIPDRMTETVLIALGGNALVRPNEDGSFDQQVENSRGIANAIAESIADGVRVVIAHGNGPQVGNVMLQNDADVTDAQRMPLFACSAASQGIIGAALSLAFESAFERKSLDSTAVPLLTPVFVSEDHDEATKPVGPFYSESEAKKRETQTDVVFKEDAGRGWRRVVPSPSPEYIRCTDQVRHALREGNVPIAAGGGGLPLAPCDDGYEYIDAVVDKDLAAAQLASQLDVDRLVILTDVSHVYLNYDEPEETRLTRVNCVTARQYQAAGHFERGSMYEKIEAVCQFVESGGTEAVIASLDNAGDAVDGNTGTRFESGSSAATTDTLQYDIQTE